MKIDCSDCHVTYDIPEEFLPQREKIAFNCKKCGCKIAFAHPLFENHVSSRKPAGDHASGVQRQSAQETVTHDPAGVRAFKSKVRMCLMGSIPPVAQIVAKAQMVVANPFAGLRDLAEVIEKDAGITTRALKIANSAYYGLSGKVTSIGHASVLLGNKILGEIITMAGVRGFLGEKLKGYGLDSGDLWRHSLAVAVSSKLLATKRSPGYAEDAFVGGLLHDAGMIMLDPYILEKKEFFEEIMGDGLHTSLDAERTVFGTDHTEVGAEILGEWGIPSALLKPVAKHHHPSASSGPLTQIVHVGDILAKRFGLGLGQDDMLYDTDRNAMEFLGMQEGDLELLRSEVCDSVDSITMDVLQETP